MKTILVATMGTTPSVLASTVWELAVHPQEFLGEEKSIVPDKVIVFGTARSKDELFKALFRRESSKKPTGWERLSLALEKKGVAVNGKLLFSLGNICTFKNDAGEEIDDIRNAKDCYCVANLIVKELRDLSAKDDCRILASMSGGRKPESAILLSCMNLLGRERDAMIHLIPTEWPSPTDGCSPPFLFPGQGSVHKTKDRKSTFKSNDIGFNLINIPFVRVRNCIPDLDGSKPLPSFGDLVSRSQQALDGSARSCQLPSVRFDFDKYSISLSNKNGASEIILLTPERFFVLACDLLLDGKLACNVFYAVRDGEPKQQEHPLLRAIRNSKIGRSRRGSSNTNSSTDPGDLTKLRFDARAPQRGRSASTDPGDLTKLRYNTKLTIKRCGGTFAFAADALAGKGYVRDDLPFRADLVSEENRKVFLAILNQGGIL